MSNQGRASLTNLHFNITAKLEQICSILTGIHSTPTAEKNVVDALGWGGYPPDIRARTAREMQICRDILIYHAWADKSGANIEVPYRAHWQAQRRSLPLHIRLEFLKFCWVPGSERIVTNAYDRLIKADEELLHLFDLLQGGHADCFLGPYYNPGESELELIPEIYKKNFERLLMDEREFQRASISGRNRYLNAAENLQELE